MDELQEYKELYYKEIEYSERLNGRVATNITFLTILGSAQIFSWSQIISFDIGWYFISDIVMNIIALILFILAVIQFYKAYTGYEYHYFPISDMAKAKAETIKIAGKDEEKVKRAEKHIYNMYCERFLNDSIANRKSNIEKNIRHRKLISYIYISFIFTCISFALCIFSKCIEKYQLFK